MRPLPFAVLTLSLAIAAFMPATARAQDLADAQRRATEMVARHLAAPRLNSAYGTPAFDVTGRRIDDVFLNFCGQDAAGCWMLMSLTLHPDGSLTGEDDPNNPRPDNYGHHGSPGIDPAAWISPEESVLSALSLHSGHEPTGGISLAYYVSSDYHGRAVMVFYWLRDHVIHDVVIDAKYGDVLNVGETPWPHDDQAPDFR